MNNLEKYRSVFVEIFSLEEDFNGAEIRLNETADWDSVGHMDLITGVEDAFDIMMETEDILAFDSYEKGIEILNKYEIEI